MAQDFVVRIEMNITADTPEEALEFALDDLADGTIPWEADVSGDGMQTWQLIQHTPKSDIV